MRLSLKSKACLANQLKCPLLSCDSDFLIFNLTHGYISINYFDMDLLERDDDDSSFFMRARIYNVDKFVDYFNSTLEYTSASVRLRKEMLAVFAVLCGNDYVDKQEVFGSFLATLEPSNNNMRLRKNAKRRGTHFERLLDWLTQFTSVDECVETVIKCCKKETHQQVREAIENSVLDYMCLRESKLVVEMGDFIRLRE